MQLLPSELKSLIAELLLSSPKSLAALARTHTAYQREAEKALYKSLSIFVTIQSINPLKCMETLATNPEKAALVRFLSFEYSHYGISKNQTLSTYLSKSLINMHSLSDFRMRSFLIEAGDSEIEAQMIRDLGRILWSVCKIFDLLKPNDSAGDTVKVIFDYKHFTATMFSTYLKSSRVKPNCRYLDYILAIRETF